MNIALNLFLSVKKVILGDDPVYPSIKTNWKLRPLENDVLIVKEKKI